MSSESQFPDFPDSTARWDYEKAHACEEHEWQPVSVEFFRTLAGGGRCYVVCLACGACTYIEVWWPGYKLANVQDRINEAEPEDSGGGE